MRSKLLNYRVCASVCRKQKSDYGQKSDYLKKCHLLTEQICSLCVVSHIYLLYDKNVFTPIGTARPTSLEESELDSILTCISKLLIKVQIALP